MGLISPFNHPLSNSSVSSLEVDAPTYLGQSFKGMDRREAGKEELTVEAARNPKETAPVTTGEDHDPSQSTTQVFGAWGGLTRQSSMTKGKCLCSPTTHAGSFRCRLHRVPSLQRTKSIDASLPAPDSPTKTDTDATD